MRYTMAPTERERERESGSERERETRATESSKLVDQKHPRHFISFLGATFNIVMRRVGII
jgi:hypothetical protein